MCPHGRELSVPENKYLAKIPLAFPNLLRGLQLMTTVTFPLQSRLCPDTSVLHGPGGPQDL